MNNLIFKVLLLIPIIILNSCATLNESLVLGAGIGAASGSIVSSETQNKNGNQYTGQENLSNIGIGLVIGAITAYLIHENTAQYRKDFYSNSPEIYFGDLPPSPFIMSPNEKKRGR